MSKDDRISVALEGLVKAIFALANAFESAGSDLSKFYGSVETEDTPETVKDSPAPRKEVIPESVVEEAPKTLNDGEVKPKKRRKRRTKAEMEAARAAEKGNSPSPSPEESPSPPSESIPDNILEDISEDGLGDLDSLGDLPESDLKGGKDLEDDLNDIEDLEESFEKKEPAKVAAGEGSDNPEDELDDLDLFN